MSSSDSSHPCSDPVWLARARDFAVRIGVEVGREELVFRALTHRSLAEGAPLGDNERLELLGDSVLALVVAEHLYRTHPDYTEGQLTKLKIRYVSEPSLAAAAAILGIGEVLAIASSDVAAGGRDRPSTLCDAFEAVIAAVYLAGGLESARTFVHRELIERIDPTVVWDYKSSLQELFQEKHRMTPVYATEAESGPAHDRTFSSRVAVDGKVIGTGTGRSKKLAEQAAAADALASLAPPKKKSRSRKKTAAVSASTAPGSSVAAVEPSLPAPERRNPQARKKSAATPVSTAPAVPAAAGKPVPAAPGKRSPRARKKAAAAPDSIAPEAPAAADKPVPTVPGKRSSRARKKAAAAPDSIAPEAPAVADKPGPTASGKRKPRARSKFAADPAATAPGRRAATDKPAPPAPGGLKPHARKKVAAAPVSPALKSRQPAADE